MDPFSRSILNNRPEITFISPESVDTIPEPSPAQKPDAHVNRIEKLIEGLKNVAKTAEVVEEAIAERAKDIVMKLDLSDPEHFNMAQAAARMFPDKALPATEEQPFPLVEEITFPMFRHCLTNLKDHGTAVAKQNQLPKVDISPKKVDFGDMGSDRRPSINPMTQIMAPLPIPLFMLAIIPIVFGLLFPLISLYTNIKIVGHTHVAIAPGAPTSPGVPLVPA